MLSNILDFTQLVCLIGISLKELAGIIPDIFYQIFYFWNIVALTVTQLSNSSVYFSVNKTVLQVTNISNLILQFM